MRVQYKPRRRPAAPTGHRARRQFAVRLDAIGFKPWDSPRIYGKPPAEDARSPAPRDERPFLPCDQFEYDQKADATAWRLTGELLNRARAGA